MNSGATRAHGRATWTWAAIGSVVFHVGLVFAASMLPEGRGGATIRDQLFVPGAVIPIEAIEPAIARAEPVMPAEPAAAEPSGPAKAPSETSPSPRPSARGSSDEPPPTPEQSDSEPNEQPGALLGGQRDGAHAASPKGFDPSALEGSREAYESSVARPGVGSGAVQGPAAPSGRPDYSFTREKGKLVYRDPHKRFVAVLRADGRVDFENKGAKASMKQIGMAGPGDLLMAASGSDPYARLKAKLLQATFEMRLNMAIGFQKKQLDRRLRRLEGELSKIWADERRPVTARRELLFQRWDECDEPDEVATAAVEVPGFGKLESSELDEARHEAARSARRRIERFIREVAPAGSPQAFSPAELADMNRRRASRQSFKPYG